MKNIKILFVTELLIIGALTALLFAGIPVPEFLPRAYHRLLHIFGAILFFGNIIVAALWLTLAGIARQPDVFRYAARLVNISDLTFTGPGLIFLLLNGAVLSAGYGKILSVPWLKWALIWFSLAGVVWMTILIPLQLRFERDAANELFPWNSAPLRKAMVVYSVFGSLTVLFVFLSFMRMVLK